MDYIKEAKQRADAAGSVVSNNPLNSMEYNMAALVCTQIAIAEQLRLANRIALASSDRIKRSDIAFSRLNVMVMKDIPKMFDINTDIPDDVDCIECGIQGLVIIISGLHEVALALIVGIVGRIA